MLSVHVSKGVARNALAPGYYIPRLQRFDSTRGAFYRFTIYHSLFTIFEAPPGAATAPCALVSATGKRHEDVERVVKAVVREMETLQFLSY